MLDDVAGLVVAGIVQAAGTDAWAAMRDRIARLLGRGDAGRERAELDRLDRTTSDLEDPGLSEEERTLLRQSWQVRLRRLLEGLDEGERARVVAALRAMVEPYAQSAQRDGGLQVAESVAVVPGRWVIGTHEGTGTGAAAPARRPPFIRSVQWCFSPSPRRRACRR
ncbi:hypothetical protein [Streptomyces sp. NPDC056669]|uniref:hypothetical protein n=1 Tax=unclassified Streptomyces TaxID=2593676 RepID=UPI0036BCBB18